MANIYRLIVSLFIVFYSSFSFSAINGVTEYQYTCLWDYKLQTSWGNPEFLCNDSFATQCGRKQGGYPTGDFTANYTPPTSCRISRIAGSYFGALSFESRNSCPPNSTASGSQCVCNSGYEEKNGSCLLPNPLDSCEGVVSFCRDLTSKRSDFLVSVSYRPDFVCQPLSIIPDVPSNLSGCKVRGCNFMTFSGSVSYKDAFNGKNYTGGEGSYTGSTCHTADELPAENPNPPENAEKPCKVGHSSGLVNGVRLCVPGSDITTDGPKKSEENADGSTSETTTKTVCNNGECTTTETTTTKDASGNVTGTSSSTTKQTEMEFCAKEPGSPFCIGVGSKPGNGLEGSEDGKENGGGTFSGTCDTGFTCKEGDAISCAIAKRLHEDSCTLSKQTEESSLYNQSKGKEGSVTGDLEGNESYGFSNIRSTSRFSASSCFQDLTVSVMGESLTIEFSKICPWLSNIGYVLVAVAWIIAATIVMRGRT